MPKCIYVDVFCLSRTKNNERVEKISDILLKNNIFFFFHSQSAEIAEKTE